MDWDSFEKELRKVISECQDLTPHEIMRKANYPQGVPSLGKGMIPSSTAMALSAVLITVQRMQG